MPNWCEGKLKVRGEKENIVKWLTECVAVWNPDVEDGKPLYDALIFRKYESGVSYTYDDDELHVCVKQEAYIAGTRRNFVQKCGKDFFFGAKDGKDIIVLPVQAAWAFESEPYEEMSKQYGLDFRLYGYECGMEFNQEIEVVNGKTTINREITFENYYWECPDPEMGG